MTVPYLSTETYEHINNHNSHVNILRQEPRVPTWTIYLIYIPGDYDPSALYLNAIKLSVCQYQLKDIFVCLLLSNDTV